jgi:prepilin-type N-terminal cleavage/methylation domain-containing protein
MMGEGITVSPLRHAEVIEIGARMRDSRKERGVTLIELLIALVLSSILIFVLYKTFLRQQKTYTVQEQVFDAQQNVRAMMARMVREIRMAGFGRVAGEHVPGVGYISRILPVQFRNTNGTVISYPNVLNRDQPSAGWLTIVTAVSSATLSAHLVGSSSRYEITVDRVNYEPNRAIFDKDNKRYISIDGVESNAIMDIREETVDGTPRYSLTLQHPLEYNYRPNTNTLVYPITAVSFQIQGREEPGESRQPIAENIKELTFEYFTTNGDPTADDEDIRMVRVSVTAETSMGDPDFKDNRRDNKGYRTRQVASNIQIRNLAFAP